MENTDGKKKEGITLYCMYKGPGPAYRLKPSIGTAEHCLTKTQAPAYSIGHKYPEKKTISPGPTYYYDSTITYKGRAHAPAFALAGRHQKTKAPDLTPGPADYDTLNIPIGAVSDQTRAPCASIGQRTHLKPATETPPPNIYNVKFGLGARSQIDRSGPAWTLRGRSDIGGAHYTGLKSANPGPASYGLVPASVYKSRSAGYTIQGRNHLKDYTTLKDNPGPNAYNPWALHQPPAVKRGFTMGIRHSEFVMPLISNADRF